MEALLPPIAAPAATPSPDPEKTRESDGGALMFDSCELAMTAVVMAIRNFRTRQQEATADNLSVGFVATYVGLISMQCGPYRGVRGMQTAKYTAAAITCFLLSRHSCFDHDLS